MGNISKGFSDDNIRLDYMDIFYNFLVDYDNIDVDNILDIHKYLMVENNTKFCSG